MSCRFQLVICLGPEEYHLDGLRNSRGVCNAAVTLQNQFRRCERCLIMGMLSAHNVDSWF